jgi:hypothetical protein
MLKSKKHVFWEAFLLTLVIFILGLLMGVAYENSRLDSINQYYAVSEISLMDIFVLGNNIGSINISCDSLTNSNIEFADRIYEEAIILEDYESAGVVTDNLKLAHKKYDLMRTFLWANSIRTLDKCGKNFDIVVYLYEYETRDLAKKATQNVWSKVLYDLKQDRGYSIILIPIAADSNLASLDSLINNFEISQFPVVIVNNKYVLDEITSASEIEKYLDE